MRKYGIMIIQRESGKGTDLWALYSYSKLMSCWDEEEEGEVPP